MEAQQDVKIEKTYELEITRVAGSRVIALVKRFGNVREGGEVVTVKPNWVHNHIWNTFAWFLCGYHREHFNHTPDLGETWQITTMFERLFDQWQHTSITSEEMHTINLACIETFKAIRSTKTSLGALPDDLTPLFLLTMAGVVGVPAAYEPQAKASNE